MGAVFIPKVTIADEAGSEFGVPPERRVLVGFSQSVSLNYRFAATHPASVRGVIGICGGYTTFSSFSLQTFALAQEGEWFHAALNTIASVALCLFAVLLGYFTITLINKP